MRRNFISAIFLVSVLTVQATGYLVPYALPLDQLARESDLVVKAVAVESRPMNDGAFPPAGPGYGAFATRLKVITVLKGSPKLTEVIFRHYDQLPGEPSVGPVSPQTYHFTSGLPYLLFAKKTDQPGVFQNFSFHHTSQPDQGLVRAADARPLARDTPIKTVVWRELIGLATGDESGAIVYAIDHLSTLSAVRWYEHRPKPDFARDDVLDVICPLLAHRDPTVVRAAVQAIGRDSPYLDDAAAPSWLATVGKGAILRRGFGTFPERYSNPSALRSRKPLVRLAEGSSSPDIRAQAIRALGRSRENEQDNGLVELLQKWSKSADAPVRAAAAMLWSDYPANERTAALAALAADEAPAVRAAAAYAIGFAQVTELLPALDRMLADPNQSLRRAAALSLLSFDPRVAGPQLKAHRGDREFKVAFINALADADPAAYRDDLVAIVKSNPMPEGNLSGQLPAFTAWETLMRYVATADEAEIRAGHFDRYLDALENPPNVGSGPFQTLQRFYQDRGLESRLQSLKTKARTN